MTTRWVRGKVLGLIPLFASATGLAAQEKPYVEFIQLSGLLISNKGTPVQAEIRRGGDCSEFLVKPDGYTCEYVTATGRLISTGVATSTTGEFTKWNAMVPTSEPPREIRIRKSGNLLLVLNEPERIIDPIQIKSIGTNRWVLEKGEWDRVRWDVSYDKGKTWRYEMAWLNQPQFSFPQVLMEMEQGKSAKAIYAIQVRRGLTVWQTFVQPGAGQFGSFLEAMASLH